MAYLGRSPVIGSQKLLDSIESQFNGVLTTFDLRYAGLPTYPTLSASLIVSLGGVLQEPTEAYYVSSDKIVFSEAPLAGTECWILLYSEFGASKTGTHSDLNLLDADDHLQYIHVDNTRTGITSSISTTGDISATDLTATGVIRAGTGTVAQEREIAWNADEGTLDVQLLNNVVNQLGQETQLLCRNDEATTLANGTAVMFSGTIGNSGRIKVKRMVADGTMPGYVFLGVTTQAIEPGADGYVTVFGKVRGVNTLGYPEQSILWCDPANPGGFTVTEPMAPNLKLPIAAVISSANNGTLMVRADSGSRLRDLHDVEANGSVQDGDVLTYKASNSRWERGNALSLAGGLTLAAGSAAAPSLRFISDLDTGLYSPGTDQVGFTTAGVERLRIGPTGDVGIGTTNPAFKLEVNGSFAATTKSFLIPHPTKCGYKLRHGSLEGPENGVYVRGKTTLSTINLPDYWRGLIDPESITVNLTPISKNTSLWVESIGDNMVRVGREDDTGAYFFIVFAERIDVEPLEVEILDKELTN